LAKFGGFRRKKATRCVGKVVVVEKKIRPRIKITGPETNFPGKNDKWGFSPPGNIRRVLTVDFKKVCRKTNG